MGSITGGFFQVNQPATQADPSSADELEDVAKKEKELKALLIDLILANMSQHPASAAKNVSDQIAALMQSH